MLRILQVIAENLAEGPATIRLPGSVPAPPDYRGLVKLERSRCLACRICAYVCISDAITGTENGSEYSWVYDPGRCTFCARCIDNCPGGALSMDPEPVPAYVHPGELAVRHQVSLPQCPDCGSPARPVTPEFLTRAFEYLNEDMGELIRRCERCRRRHLQRNLFALVAWEGKDGAE